jgi:hypothetical protein
MRKASGQQCGRFVPQGTRVIDTRGAIQEREVRLMVRLRVEVRLRIEMKHGERLPMR